MSESGQGMSGRRALAGLLVVCVLLAAGLLGTALLSFRATRRAADAVMLSRATQVAAQFAATARVMHALHDETMLSELVKEIDSPGVEVAVLDLEGKVVATSSDKPRVVRAGWLVLLTDLRTHGQAHRTVTRDGQSFLVYWRPLGGFGRMYRRFGQTPPPPGSDPPRWPGPPAAQWRQHMRRNARLLRVMVASTIAQDLINPARYAVVFAGAGAAVLLLVGLGLFRSAGRAQRAERELQHRRNLAALGEMAAVLAHEIRTPLGGIKGNAQLVGERQPDDTRIGAIVRETERLERLVNGLLAYARPVAPQRTAVDPDEVARRAASVVAPAAEAAGVNLLIEPADCGRCMQADGDQLLQVLVNLLQNALEAAPSGAAPPGPVTLTAKRKPGQVVFTVSDRGPGLHGADAAQLVRPFHSSKANGTGLGLSVAHQIVQAHGGSLELADREGGGTVATVRIPTRG